MIDCELETLITLKQAAQRLPCSKIGRVLSISTVWRWALQQDDPLETITVGGRRYTSMEAIARFIERCNRKVPAASTKPAERAQNAGKELRKLIGGSHV